MAFPFSKGVGAVKVGAAGKPMAPPSKKLAKGGVVAKPMARPMAGKR